MHPRIAKLLIAAVAAIALAAVSLAGGAPAIAYTTTGCHWSTTGPTYTNNGGALSSEVTTSVAKWITATDLTAMSNTPSSNFKVGLSNMGANGYSGWTNWVCALFGVTSSADAKLNTYYTNAYSVAKRQAVWVHELGHGLGLDHSTLANAIMNSCPPCVYNSYGTNVPITDDINGMNSLY